MRHALHIRRETVPKPPQVNGRRQAPRLGPQDVGVICFYRSQVDEVKKQLLRVLPKELADLVQVSTVDAFQGSERNHFPFSRANTGIIADLCSAAGTAAWQYRGLPYVPPASVRCADSRQATTRRCRCRGHSQAAWGVVACMQSRYQIPCLNCCALNFPFALTERTCICHCI